jgi:hypothetical protein
MGRPKLKNEEKKLKLSITIDKELNDKLGSVTNNKSKFITKLLLKYFNNEI